MNTKLKKTGIILLLFLWCFVFPSQDLKAEDAEIINEVSTSANSGGNTAENGERVIEGNSQASVKIKTEVDGENVQNTNIEINSASGEEKIIKKENIVSNDGETSVRTEVELMVEGRLVEETNVDQKSFVRSLAETIYEGIKNFFRIFK